MTSLLQLSDRVNRRWRVFGRIAGQYLPSTPVRIGNVTVGPLPEGINVLERIKGLKAASIGSDTYFVGYSGDIDVKSRCYFWADKTATSSELALAHVLSEDILPLQIAFSLYSDREPYRIEALWITDFNQNEGCFSHISFGYWLPEEPTPAWLANVAYDYNILKSRDNARHAAEFFSRAIRQEVVAGDDVTARESALLTFFKVIEVISTRIVGEVPSDREKKQGEIISRLQKVLNSGKSVTKKVSATHDAVTSLHRLDGNYLSMKIESAANQLELSKEWKHAATKLARLRNTQLGHAGSKPKDKEDAISQWRSVTIETGYTAQRLAREILMAYVSRLRKTPRT